MDPTAAATRLRQRASALRGLARRMDLLRVLTLHTRCGTDTWVGPSQFHCEHDLRSHRLALLGQSLELQRRARHLDRVAEDLEQTAWSAAR